MLIYLLFLNCEKRKMTFKPPNAARRLHAIGPVEELSETLRLAFDPSTDFEPIPIPNPNDWLAMHLEPGQTFNDFFKLKPKRPNSFKCRIYLQPFGDFSKGRSPSIERLWAYAAAYFKMDVEVLSPLTLSDYQVTTRINPFTRKRQILTKDVLDLLRKRLPEDGFCILALTMEDLYPQPSWNFCFGQASLVHRVGVFSFARYDPAFFGGERELNYQKILLWRSCKVLTHEAAHMFGLSHCIFFKCVINGSNHLEESDARPMHLCPVCLRKLHFSIQFDVLDRYRQLLLFYKTVRFEKEAQWVSNRLKNISHDLNPSF